jgi:hypothetical protein
VADLLVEGDELVVRLSRLEKAEAVHGEIRVPLSAVTQLEVVDDAIHQVHGIRVGTGIPGSTAVGTFTTKTVKMFAAVHRDTPRAVLVTLTGAQFDQLLIGSPDPEAVVASLPATH